MNRLKLLAAALLAASAIPAHAIGNLADLRIHDRTSGRELPVYWHEGRAYVVGKPGNEYQVTVRNKAGEDLLAVMSVDGVNVLSGETASAQQGGYVISSWDSLDVRGWRKSLGHTAAFYFTSLGDSYAGRTGRPGNVGVIGVALYRRQYQEPPRISQYAPAPFAREKRAESEGESARSADSTASPEVTTRPAPSVSAAAPKSESAASGLMARRPGAPLGTGHGREEASPARYVNFQRASEYPVETVTIYYDSYRNLVARGILTQPIAPRDPRPFPGFVPDPA